MNHVHVFLFGLHLFTSAHGFDVGALDSQVMQRSYFYTLFGFFYPFLSMLYVKPFKFRKKQKNNSKQFDTFTEIHFYHTEYPGQDLKTKAAALARYLEKRKRPMEDEELTHTAQQLELRKIKKGWSSTVNGWVVMSGGTSYYSNRD